jgi:carbon storage regulator CsrA
LEGRDVGYGPGSELGPAHDANKERKVLVISRKKDQSFYITDNIRVVCIEVRGDKCRFGIDAPKDFPIRREELESDRPGKLIFVPEGFEAVLQPIAAADGDQPVTEEWLRSIGFEQRDPEEAELSLELFEGDGLLEVIPFAESVAQWWLYGHEFHPAPTSRSEVRRLCIALSLDVKEPAK